MKVAINVSRENLGGITTTNLNLIKYLYQNNHTVFGIELNSRRYMKGPTIYRQLDPSLFDHNIINIHDIDFGNLVANNLSLKVIKDRYKEIILLVEEILSKNKPDVIIISGTYFIPWIISLAAQKVGIPVLLWYAGVLTQETQHRPKNEQKLYREIERSIVRRAQKIIFPSALCKQTVQNNVTDISNIDTFIIPNPVARTYLDENAVSFPNHTSIAGIGRYSKVKNFDKYFDIHVQLLKQGFEHECNFVSNISSLEKKKLPNSINVLPSMDTEELKKFYLSQSLIICPSTFETFGNVPMEAVSMGIPVLVNTTMGCAEILRKAGLKNMIVDFNDMPQVIERIKILCGQSILPKQINAVRKLLNPELINAEITSIIKSIIRGN